MSHSCIAGVLTSILFIIQKPSTRPLLSIGVKKDQIITLATCTSRVRDERVVLHAKLSKEKK